MVIINGVENPKKRKKEDIDPSEIVFKDGDVCTQEESPRKTFKLDSSPDDDLSSESSSDSESDTDEQSPDDSGFKDQLGQSSKILLLPIPQPVTVVDTQAEKQGVLKLNRNHVFIRFLIVFSQETLPQKIMFDGQGYNLTEAYDEFWKTFYKSSYYSMGNNLKIPNVRTLIGVEVKSLVKILKRGWEDEHYWPEGLSRPFLEACLFGEGNTNSITPETFLKFIEPSDQELIKNQSSVDHTVLKIIKKYCSGNTVSIGDDMNESCIKAGIEIMLTNMKPVIDIWGKELSDIMPKSKFDLLTGPSPIPRPPPQDPITLGMYWKLKEVDLEGHVAPHRLWKTFFLGWSEDKVRFYFDLLANTIFDSECNLCGEKGFNAKHFLCVCEETLETLRLDRHDAVLMKLLNHIGLAIERKGCYFGMGENWKVLSSHRNKHYKWPEEMIELKYLSPQRFPHIIVYSTSPEKRALIIEYSISWEYWMDLEQEKKTDRYNPVRRQLEEIGFTVEYRVFVLGSRGVFIRDLYNLFEQVLDMKHSEISHAMEEISQEILNIPYQSDYYKELKETGVFT